MKAIQTLLLAVLAIFPAVFAWTDLGHIATGEIARRALTKSQVDKVNSLTTSYGDYFPHDVSVLPYSATFMDYVKRDTSMFDSMHFLNTPYIRDGEFGQFFPQPTNAVSSLKEVSKTLYFKKSKTSQIWGKAFSTLVLIHVVGDLHQPLHATSLLSDEYKFFPPGGDLGGNNYKIVYDAPDGRSYDQLHLLYDCIAGAVCDYMPEKVTPEYENSIKIFVDELMEEFPESSFDKETLYPSTMFESADKFEAAVKDWAVESYEHAVRFYEMVPHQKTVLTQEFIQPLIKVLRQRIAMGGYRIGYLLKNANVVKNGPRAFDFGVYQTMAVFIAVALIVTITIACIYRSKYKNYSRIPENGLMYE